MARLQKIKVPTTEFIEDLAQEAARGNADALNELGRLNEKLGRTANQRLRDLEKKGYTSSEAYKQAQYRMNADRPRYSQAHTGSAWTLAESAQQAAQFLRYKTSTVGGVREKARKGFAAIKEKIEESMHKAGAKKFKAGAHFKDVKKLTDAQIEKELDRFIKSDAFTELRRSIGSPVIEAVAEKLSGGADLDELLDAFEQWERGDLDVGVLTLWDGWSKK